MKHYRLVSIPLTSRYLSKGKFSVFAPRNSPLVNPKNERVKNSN